MTDTRPTDATIDEQAGERLSASCQRAAAAHPGHADGPHLGPDDLPIPSA